MPSRVQVRITRAAISPRLAISSRRIRVTVSAPHPTRPKAPPPAARRRRRRTRRCRAELHDGAPDAGVHRRHHLHGLDDADHGLLVDRRRRRRRTARRPAAAPGRRCPAAAGAPRPGPPPRRRRYGLVPGPAPRAAARVAIVALDQHRFAARPAARPSSRPRPRGARSASGRRAPGAARPGRWSPARARTSRTSSGVSSMRLSPPRGACRPSRLSTWSNGRAAGAATFARSFCRPDRLRPALQQEHVVPRRRVRDGPLDVLRAAVVRLDLPGDRDQFGDLVVGDRRPVAQLRRDVVLDHPVARRVGPVPAGLGGRRSASRLAGHLADDEASRA